jgi:hypothetical protein
VVARRGVDDTALEARVTTNENMHAVGFARIEMVENMWPHSWDASNRRGLPSLSHRFGAGPRWSAYSSMCRADVPAGCR